MGKQEQINFDEEMRRLARRDPFIPFEIVVASGDRYEVTDPLQIAIGGDAIVLLLPRTGMRMFRTFQVVSIHTREAA